VERRVVVLGVFMVASRRKIPEALSRRRGDFYGASLVHQYGFLCAHRDDIKAPKREVKDLLSSLQAAIGSIRRSFTSFLMNLTGIMCKTRHPERSRGICLFWIMNENRRKNRSSRRFAPPYDRGENPPTSFVNVFDAWRRKFAQDDVGGRL
jgi:hypothetical protein